MSEPPLLEYELLLVDIDGLLQSMLILEGLVEEGGFVQESGLPCGYCKVGKPSTHLARVRLLNVHEWVPV